MKILVATDKPFAKTATDGIREIVTSAGHTLTLFEKYTSQEELYEAVKDADAMIVRSDKITSTVLEHAKNLKIVVRAGAGYDNIDLETSKSKGVVVMNTPGQNSNAVAELALGMMIFISRNSFTPGTGAELMGKTIGIHAFGNVGRRVAKLASGFGMKVIIHDIYLPKDDTESKNYTVVDTVEELYKNSQYISLHIPATAQTKGSIGYELLSMMPKGGVLVNTARKEVINEDGLYRALKERADLKYITDIPADNQQLLNEEFGVRVFASPKKMGAETAEANINAGLAAANQIVKFLATGDETFRVNK